ncbi:MAG: PrgI family protein [Candidatus Kerfeldbacteria bacterium]|nr:PrgI family protein [Candidatus Kerfeldbacteria bacterium]
MQFVVPQFIEVESKVIGPISVRQFLILLVTAGLIFLLYEIFSFVIFAVLGVFTLTLGGTFAFAKVNSQPFHLFALSLIQTLKRPHLSIWRRDPVHQVITKLSRKDRKKDHKDNDQFTPKPEVSQSQLAELSLIMDTAGKYSPAQADQT